MLEKLMLNRQCRLTDKKRGAPCGLCREAIVSVMQCVSVALTREIDTLFLARPLRSCIYLFTVGHEHRGPSPAARHEARRQTPLVSCQSQKWGKRSQMIDTSFDIV